jgi:hypothetical protein
VRALEVRADALRGLDRRQCADSQRVDLHQHVVPCLSSQGWRGSGIRLELTSQASFSTKMPSCSRAEEDRGILPCEFPDPGQAGGWGEGYLRLRCLPWSAAAASAWCPSRAGPLRTGSP